MKIKKVMGLFLALSVVLCMSAVCFATSPSGSAGFASEVTTALSADNIWGAITPLVPLIAVITLIAVARYVANKNLSGAKKGKSGRV